MEVEAGLIKIMGKHLFAIAVFNGDICTHYLYNDRLLEELIEENVNTMEFQVPEYLSEVIAGCNRSMWAYYSRYNSGDITYDPIKKYKIEDLMELSLNLTEQIKRLNA